jgi:hypothetical protein
MGNNSQNNWRNKMTARLVCGWGHNDSPVGYIYRDCPFYRKWYDMVRRCHSRNYQKTHPTYKGVTICEEWKFFSAFKKWMQTKDWEGKELDKDIRIPGNKKYWPDACMFVKRHINSLKLFEPRKYLDDHPYPQGVFLSERKKGPDKYVSVITTDGKLKRIDTFPTVEAASSAYCKKKAEYLRVLAEKQEPILKEALLRWADIYELEIVYLRDNKR